ncbi:alkaline phosphatase, tissue-nonspecific isozyme [Apis cerana cerana]|uniref:Alkaline phosphatase, tissue-nonspecific isozyme n=1 Tax=Apis cerana cerana TaxID=94128 RepID=A0A2A3EMF8_APICC|nr:alkaline phosphatase, tissue-nonspecific isozyme [Apis cerana cerana]
MPKLNKLLVTSIIADIRECVHVSNEIYSWLGDIEHLSWKFPTKTAKDINAMEIVKEHEGTAGEFYILLLELAYDRIHFVLRLIVEFMDKFRLADEFFKEVSCVSRSKQISLASLLRLVWDRMKTMPDSISRHMVVFSVDCSRDECRNDIYEKTQWAVMSRLTKGIGTDIETALRIARESNLRSQAAREDHEHKIRDLRASLTMREKRTEELQADNSGLKDLLRNGRFLRLGTRCTTQIFKRLRVNEISGGIESGTELVRTSLFIEALIFTAREELEEERRGNDVLKRQNETLKETLGDIRRQMSMLAGENKILQSQAVALAESKFELEKTVIGLGKEIDDIRDARLESERNTRTLLDESRKENDCLKEEYEGKVEKLRQEVAFLSGKKREDEKDANGDSMVGTIEDAIVLKPEDDPVADMTQQLISNREKIEMLTRQNERLTKTLSRLRKYRLTNIVDNVDRRK